MVHRISIREKLVIANINPTIVHRTHLWVLGSNLMLAKVPYYAEFAGLILKYPLLN